MRPCGRGFFQAKAQLKFIAMNAVENHDSGHSTSLMTRVQLINDLNFTGLWPWFCG